MSREMIDDAPTRAEFLRDVLDGLGATPKTLPCKYFYDERGSALFDRICELDAYYPTRTETAIMERHAQEMAGAIGPDALLIEPGAGSLQKATLLLEHMQSPAGFVPIDISADHLRAAAESLRSELPGVEILPHAADFNETLDIPEPSATPRRRVVYFPGSTIGNLGPAQRITLLSRFRDLAGAGGGVLLGIDLVKDTEILERAYNDEEGVTAEFNLNLLRRINDELGGGFDLGAFEHHAFYNPARARIEMHLRSSRDQGVQIGDHTFRFEQGESIRTELSHKFTVESMASEAERAGLTLRTHWTDDRAWFAVLWFEVA